jgi:hypothetical protein
MVRQNEVRSVLVAALLLAACSAEPSDQEIASDESFITISHTFDYASKAPSRLSIMFTMAWFGIEDNVGDSPLEPQTPAGKDPVYHNWKAASGGCAIVSPDPTASSTCVRLGVGNTCVDWAPNGVLQRKISSRRRPLTGIWSGTGRDVESQRKLDLMLAMLRRPGCRADDGAKLDAWTMQNNSVKFSSKYVANPGAAEDYPYRTMMALFDRADLASIPNAVLPGFDSTWYFHFGSAVGLGKCDGTSGNPRSNCLNAVRDDIRDLAVEANKRTSAVKVAGKPVVFVYTDPYQAQGAGNGGHQPSASEWSSTLDAARSLAGFDFYAIAVGADPAFFGAFDALAPWLGSSSYVNHAGTSVYSDSYGHTQGRHASLVAGVGGYPGRLVYGGVTPGFDDWTRNWSGPCQERQMPPDSVRDPNLMTAQMDFFHSCKTGAGCITSPKTISKYDFRGFIGETWDDWTEGSEFEPDVYEGPDRLVRLRQLLGRVFGDTYPDTTGDSRLTQRWTSYGQARDATGGAATTPPATNLACDASCGPPAITTPSAGQSVGPDIHLRVSAPSCIDAIKCYVDSNPTVVASASTSAIDAWVPVTMGSHVVQCNGWDSGVVYRSPFVSFTRTY